MGKTKGKKTVAREMTVADAMKLFTAEERERYDNVRKTIDELADIFGKRDNGIRMNDLRRFLWYAGSQIIDHPERKAEEIHSRWLTIAAGHRSYMTCTKGAKLLPPQTGSLAEFVSKALVLALTETVWRIAERHVDVKG